MQELYSWYCPEKGQLLIIHHPCAAVTILNVDAKYNKVEEKLVMTPFAIGSTKVSSCGIIKFENFDQIAFCFHLVRGLFTGYLNAQPID